MQREGREQEGAGADGERPRRPEPRPEPERYGPLAVSSLHKDDGRALLAFSRAHDERAPVTESRP